MINNRQNGRRRGRGGQPPRNGQSNPHGGNRIDNRQRGNAAQLLEKYKTLARDAQMAGDRVNTEYYLQFADHYFRVLSENRARFEEQQGQQGQRGRQRDEFGPEDEGDEDGNPFTRPYASREAAGEDGWDEDEGEQAPAPAPVQQRREFQPRDQPRDQPRERRPMQNERDNGNRPQDERDNAERGGRRNADHRRANNGQMNSGGGRAPAEPATPEGPSEPTSTPARIEIALPPALTMPIASDATQAAPELPMDTPVDAAEAPAPKRRRTRKPKADATSAEA